MPGPVNLLATLLACAPARDGAVHVLSRRPDDTYVVEAREIAGIDDGVPDAGNVGVVRLEFGDARFELLVTGEIGSDDIPWGQAGVDTTLGIGALNEGFADMMATLLLDAPEFFSRSFDMPSRDVRG